MKLNHLNLTVTDVPAAAAFLTTYFGLRRPEDDTPNRNFVILYDDDDLVLGLMKGSHSTEVRYPGNFHIGFIQESEARVDEINQRLRDDGYAVEPPQRHHAWTFYIQAPGGFTIEVLA